MQPWVTVVLLGAAIIGLALIKPNRERMTKGAAVQDIETALEQFADELQEENEQLIKFIAGLKHELEADVNKLSGRVEALERSQLQLPVVLSAAAQAEQQVSVGRSTTTEASQTEERRFPSQPVDELVTSSSEQRLKDTSIRHRYADVFALHEQGKSIEYIAKKNDMNKGEVQLIIQLAKQEEKFRD